MRMAVCATLDRASQRIAPLMATKGGMTETQARVAANALVFGYFGALEQWYLDGGIHPIAQYVEEGMPATAQHLGNARRLDLIPWAALDSGCDDAGECLVLGNR